MHTSPPHTFYKRILIGFSVNGAAASTPRGDTENLTEALSGSDAERRPIVPPYRAIKGNRKLVKVPPNLLTA
jgi:hypothetical protein